MTEIRYVREVGTFLARNRGDAPGSPGSVQKLLGARLHIDENDVVGAFDAGRLGSMDLLVRRDVSGDPDVLADTGPDMTFEVPGPVTTTGSGAIRLPAFHDPHAVSATNPHPSPRCRSAGRSKVTDLSHFHHGRQRSGPEQVSRP